MYLLVTARALVDESGMNSDGESTTDQQWSQRLGRLGRYHSVTVTVTVNIHAM
jgi:hypothetical protein